MSPLGDAGTPNPQMICPHCKAEYKKTEKTCPECGERNPTRLTTRQKILWGTLVILVVAVILQALFDPFAHGSDTTTTQAQTPAQTAAPKEEDHYIEGISPQGCNLIMQQQGFETATTLDPENGCLWKNTMTKGGIAYEVSFFSPKEASKVQSIRVSAQIETGNPSISKAHWLFAMMATAPFADENGNKAKTWVESHYDTKKAKTTIGGIHYEMNSPTKFVRMLSISKE